jgi:hypothetical protein
LGVPIGFSSEAWDVIQRKPNARILDCTAGNRGIHGSNKFSDEIIFTDKESNLFYKPDLVSTWIDLPKHFPKDYFKCIIFDPPHIFSLTNRFNRDPSRLSNGSKKIPGWYGAFSSERDASRQIYQAQRSLSELSNRMCFKWNEASMSIDKVLTLFDKWVPQFEPQRWVAHDGPKRSTVWTWWVKMVRRDGV